MKANLMFVNIIGSTIKINEEMSHVIIYSWKFYIEQEKSFTLLGGNKRPCVLKQTSRFVLVRMTFCYQQALKGWPSNFFLKK